jgi:hypothetical protein
VPRGILFVEQRLWKDRLLGCLERGGVVAVFNAILKLDQRFNFGLAKSPNLERQRCFV